MVTMPYIIFSWLTHFITWNLYFWPTHITLYYFHITLKISEGNNYLPLCSLQIINHLRNGHKSQMEMKLLSLLTVKSECDMWLRFKAKSGLALNWFYSPSHCTGPSNLIPSPERVRSVQMGINWRKRRWQILERMSYACSETFFL